jgi:hypothetical protein
MNITLDEREWQTVLQVLAGGPWNVVNPLLMKIGQQMQPAQGIAPSDFQKARQQMMDDALKGNSGEQPNHRGD